MLALSHVNEPTNFLAVINTCQEFNELLHSIKTDGLLPLVSCVLNELLYQLNSSIRGEI